MPSNLVVQPRSGEKPRRVIPEWVLFNVLEAVRSYCRAVLGGLLPPPANVQIVLNAVMKMTDDEWRDALTEAFELSIAVVGADLGLPYETTRRFAERKLLWGCKCIDSRYLVRNARLDPSLPQGKYTPPLVLMAAAVRFHRVVCDYFAAVERQPIGPDTGARHVLDDIRAIVDHALVMASSTPLYLSLETVAKQHRWSLKHVYALARARRLYGCSKIGAKWKALNPELLDSALVKTALAARAAGVIGA
jgi:hypothetical protein